MAAISVSEVSFSFPSVFGILALELPVLSFHSVRVPVVLWKDFNSPLYFLLLGGCVVFYLLGCPIELILLQMWWACLIKELFNYKAKTWLGWMARESPRDRTLLMKYTARIGCLTEFASWTHILLGLLGSTMSMVPKIMQCSHTLCKYCVEWLPRRTGMSEQWLDDKCGNLQSSLWTGPLELLSGSSSGSKKNELKFAFLGACKWNNKTFSYRDVCSSGPHSYMMYQSEFHHPFDKMYWPQ